jgi:hypothetical protein
MSVNLTENLLDPSVIAKWINERQFIWQIRFISAADLCTFGRDRGLNYWCLDNEIERLWQVGLLRADLVISQHSLEDAGLTLIEQTEEGQYLYSDGRNCVEREEGLGGVFGELEEFPRGVALLVHPFRYFVLRQIEQTLEINIGKTQILRFPDGFSNVLRNHVEVFGQHTAAHTFLDRVRHWNEVASMAIAAEPFTFNRLFGVYSIPYQYAHNGNEKEFRVILREHFLEYAEIMRPIGIERFKELIAELNQEARSLEPNADVLKVLRFTKRRYRLERVKGLLGGAVYLITMAEMLRRAAELIFETNLPEENDSDGFNEYFYGAGRLSDDYKARGEFLRNLGLDHSVRLRWYVEGDTEFGALENELGRDQNIELVNLRGEVVAGKGKGLSFRENLLADMNRSIYSWVSLDGDVENNLKVLLKAVDEDAMFGMFFISNPDFEFENFTGDELIETLWQVALEREADPSEKQVLLQNTSSAESAKELFKAAKKAVPSLHGFDKGKSWGTRLMEVARNNHKFRGDRSWKTRPVIESVILARHTADCNYFLSRKECEIDKKTGRIVKKPKEQNP